MADRELPLISKPLFRGEDANREILFSNFEDAWFRGEQPDLTKYVEIHQVRDPLTLAELAHVDLECRLNAGVPVMVEFYLDRFPPLAADPTLCVELIVAERHLRSQRGKAPESEDFYQRFPQFEEELRQALGGGDPCVSSDWLGSDLPQNWREEFAAEIPRYRLDNEVGRGTFGIVFQAWDTELNRSVAVKVGRFKNGKVAAEAYVEEARFLASLDHPNILPVYDLGRTTSGQHFIVSKLIRGENLRSRAVSLTVVEVVSLIAKISEALQYAHAKGLVHRDVKPANILIDSNATPYLCDFGLALSDWTPRAQPEVVGTPAYMSPEQARGDVNRVDGRSDVYSIGVVLYELLTGRTPFQGEPRDVLRQVSQHDVRPPRQFKDDIPEELERICLKALSRDPSERYTTAGDLAEQLNNFANRREQQSTDPKRPRWTMVLAAGCWVAVVLIILAMALIRLRTPIGTLVVNVDDANAIGAKVTIDGENRITITREGDEEIRVAADQKRHTLSVTKGGFQTFTREFSVSHGDAKVIQVTLRPITDGFRWEPSAPSPAIFPFPEEKAREHQEAWAAHLGVAVQRVIRLGGGNDLTMMLIPPGEFWMGSTDEEQKEMLTWAVENGRPSQEVNYLHSEKPRHLVRITKPFWLSRHEVTRGQFAQFIHDSGYTTEAEFTGRGGRRYVAGKWRSDPRSVWDGDLGFRQDDSHPVVMVGREDVEAFCRWISRQVADLRFQLPTEAQWEYACRAGSTNPWHFGDSKELLRQYGWHKAQAVTGTLPVGILKPNAFSLCDMYGNVWERCSDSYQGVYYGIAPRNDPRGPTRVSYQVIRGGSWGSPAELCQSARRASSNQPTSYCGFRVAAPISEGATTLVFQGSASSVTGALVLIDGEQHSMIDQDRSASVKIVADGEPHAIAIRKEGYLPFRSDFKASIGERLVFPFDLKPREVKHSWAASAPPPAVAPFDAQEAKRLQSSWAKHENTPIALEIKLPDDETLTMVFVPPGEFMMGSAEAERAALLETASEWAKNRIPGEGPLHRVRITEGFYLGQCEVTQGQWNSLMEGNPSYRQDNPKLPIEQVTWHQAQAFINRLNSFQTERKIRFVLPSEAQWEFACRAGSLETRSLENGNALSQFCWCKYGRDKASTHPVGQLKPNAFGLHDMYGNVWEWCADWYAPNYYRTSPVVNPHGPLSGVAKVYRGGGWLNDSRYCRSASREWRTPGSLGSGLGFRLAGILIDAD